MSEVTTDAQLRPREIIEAVRRLEAGELVGLPTETVYGLAADARTPKRSPRSTPPRGDPPITP